MTIWVLRAVFFLSGAAVAYSIGHEMSNPFLWFSIGIAVSGLLVVFEMFFSRSPLAAVSSIVFGTLVGLAFALIAQQISLMIFEDFIQDPEIFKRSAGLAFMVVFVYLAIAFLYQTRDKFRVVIPYVEFRKEERGSKPVLLDTSVIVDGRVAEILGTGIINDPIVIPQMVLQELHNIADSDDKLRRERGRLGIQMLDDIRQNPDIDTRIKTLDSDSNKPVDERLVEIAKQHGARIMTNDYNLNRIASLEGIDIINLNELAGALKPVALPDEKLTVKLLRTGEQSDQAVGYLQDGTMVVVEDAAAQIGEEAEIVVTNTITRETGRIIFGQLASEKKRKAGRQKRS
ncbi:MAG: PIN domain-containing protein [Planctomycetes bacterium]|nr:PIN domain-containing protein [Planctomycetota bacterium]